MNKIEIIANESCDYFILKYNDESYYEGHSIPDFIWIELLRKQGVEIVDTELSNEDFEELYS